MANRFTQITPSQFNPLSLQEIMMVPMAKQKQHEAQQEAIASLDPLDVARLTQDDAAVSAETKRLRDATTALEDELLNQGVSSALTQRFLNLKRDRNRFMSNEGIGGKAQTAYKAYQQNVKDIVSSSMPEAWKQNAIQYAKKRYQGYESGYSPYSGPEDTDINQVAIDYATKMKPVVMKNVTEDLKGMGYEYNEGTNRWIKDGVRLERLPAELIKKHITPLLTNNQDVMSYLTEGYRLGAIKDPQEVLAKAITGAANLLQVNNVEYDQQFKFGQKEDTGSGDGEETPPTVGESFFTRTIPVTSDLFDMSLDENYDTADKLALAGSTSFSASGNFSQKAFEAALANKSPEERAKVEFKNEGLNRVSEYMFNKKAGALTAEEYNQVKDYNENIAKKYGGMNINTTIIDPTTTSLGIGLAEGTIAKDKNAFTDYVDKRKHNARFLDQNGKVYNKWSDVAKAFGIDPKSKVDNVDGIVSWDNTLSQLIPEESKDYADDFISPIAIKLYDEKGEEVNLYMSRPEGDKTYGKGLRRANKELQNSVVPMQMTPTIPVEVTLYDNVQGKAAKTKMSFYPKPLLQKEILNTVENIAGIDISGLQGATIDEKLVQVAKNPGLLNLPEAEAEQVKETIEKYISIGDNEGLYGFYQMVNGSPRFNKDIKQYISQEEYQTNVYNAYNVGLKK